MIEEGKHQLNWSASQAQQFRVADDLRVSPFYEDGKTFGTPTWIWSVVVDGQLYIRAWHGQKSRWYRSAVTQGSGKITIAGQNYLTTFNCVKNETLNRQIDQAYELKYGNSPYLLPMLANGPRSTTMQVLPRSERK